MSTPVEKETYSDDEGVLSDSRTFGYEEDAENSTLYTTAGRRTTSRLAEELLDDYSEINATPKVSGTVSVGHVPANNKRSTPQCNVGTSGTSSEAVCGQTTKVSVAKYQHKQ